MQIIGIDIGGTKCSVVKTRPDGTIIHTTRFETTDCRSTLERIFSAVASLEPGEAPSFGISCGGPQDSARGIIHAPPNLSDWVDVPITRLLTERFGGRAWMMNDANACALAEWQFGAGRGAHNMVFLTFGTGLGAGLILNGRLYEGTNQNAGEVGHIRLAEDGPVGYGKAGSFEGFCSGGGIAQLARLRARSSGNPVCFNNAPIEEVTARDVALAADQGDPVALEILRESGRRLGQGLAILIDVLNPECIVIGGIFTRCQKYLDPPMREILQRECLSFSLEVCRVAPAALGESLGDHSAIAVALYHLKCDTSATLPGREVSER